LIISFLTIVIFVMRKGGKNMQLLKRFEDLPLSPEILRGIKELEFEELLPIQAQAMTPLLQGKNVIGQAQTGTGKTAAFGVPMLERLRRDDKQVQGLVLVPTRELALQVADHINRFSKYTPLRALPIYGGESIQKQIFALRRGVQVVVGTPGRIIDHLKRGTLRLSTVMVVVLDEADRMLDMGFIRDIDYILTRVPRNRQISLFSATIDASVMRISRKYMDNPEKILVSKDEIAVPQITQFYTTVNPREKFDVLSKLINEENIKRAVVFCRTRRGTARLADKLRNRGYDAEAIHGDLSQAQREGIVNAFRNYQIQLLVATDVAARGLDIEGITHVLNYDVPFDAVMYFHRIGRTARVGRDGTAISLVSYGEASEFERIQALTKTKIERMEIA
jgi:ATP-dependent RNA helicase DeaD